MDREIDRIYHYGVRIPSVFKIDKSSPLLLSTKTSPIWTTLHPNELKEREKWHACINQCKL